MISQELLIRFKKPIKGIHPEYLHSPYQSSLKRAPSKPLIHLEQTITEITGPRFDPATIKVSSDLTKGFGGEPLGERIVVHGYVRDENGKPVVNSLIEIWQANAAGRYLHKKDQHDAPLDPNFSGVGVTITNNDGYYSFKTIKPGAYPWKNHFNAWRPMHIHFSLFGEAFATRLVTQMYFPGDPLLALDPIFNSISNEKAKSGLISKFDLDATVPEYALAYRFDITLRGKEETLFENKI